MDIKTKQAGGYTNVDEARVLDGLLQEAQHLETEIRRLEKTENRISWARLSWILLAAVLLYYLFKWHLAAGIGGIILTAGVFLFLINWHVRVQRDRNFQRKKGDVVRQDIDCLKGIFPDTDPGTRYADETHPYTDDLDIFGQKSLYQYLNRTRTMTGSDKLARALKQPAPPKDIRLRQEAARELAPKREFRIAYQAKAQTGNDDTSDFRAILEWAASPNLLLPKKWLNWVRYVVPLITVFLFSTVIALYPLSLLVFVILIPGYFLYKFAKQIDEIHRQTEHSFQLLNEYAILIEHVQHHTYTSSLLRDIQKRFVRPGKTDAYAAIRKFSYLIRQLNVRRNDFSMILNLFGLWDFHWALALEKWKTEHRDELPGWVDALGEIDFLLTLASAAHLHPGWTFPEVHPDGPIELKGAGHPLIFHEKVVRNDLAMPGKNKIRLITGSNMAGKSTFLRTIGIQMVMAFAGFPVYATTCRLPVKHIFTSMRTKDNLQESTSSFYAELKRLRAALEAVKTREDVFFLLDEILKGTNSVDRHTGSRALILQLLDADGVGLIATHDLALTSLEEETEGKMENWNFDVEIRDGEMLFDYKIKRGVCSSFNATHLMEQMGFNLKYLKEERK